jgi:seryl-tRNA synthetase
MKITFTADDKASSALDFLRGVHQTMREQAFDDSLSQRLRQGESAFAVGCTAGRTVQAILDECSSRKAENDELIWQNTNLRIHIQTLEDEHLLEELSQLQKNNKSLSQNWEKAKMQLTSVQYELKKERENSKQDINRLIQKNSDLKGIISRQEIQLQNILGEDQSTQNS